MRTRKLRLDICDYKNNILCNIYNNEVDVSGQATDVFIISERNGWKELTFKLPSTCVGEEGEERNFRLDYLIADYRIRAIDDYETDWYLISEPKITHDAFSTDIEVRAGHICQLLKTKAYDLEFSDEEGNNVGTAEQLLTTILEGTGWEVGIVDEFIELDGSIKKRSLQEEAKTGAFKMIEDLCELFEAKPVYHGNSKTVDIVHMNPFSKTPEGEIPAEVLEGTDVLELHYDKNTFKISRTANTENIVTKLGAYGNMGDANLGYCGLETCTHKEYTMVIPESYSSGTEFCFTVDGIPYYFTATNSVNTNTVLVWSDLDFASRSYVWNNNARKAYHIHKIPQKEEWVEVEVTEADVQNYFPYLFNFDYYDKVGLLTDDMLQEVAKFQRDIPSYYNTSITASTNFNDKLSELSELAQSNTGFLKLNISSNYGVDNSDEENEGLLKLTITKNNTYPDGVIYRSDYLETRKNYFQWYVASQLKPNGLPVSGIGSVLFIIHNTNPASYDKVYVKAIWNDDNNIYLGSNNKPGTFSYKDHEDSPAALTLWASSDQITYRSGDKYYLFCTDSMSGKLGEKTVEVETLMNSVSESTKEATKEGTVDHVLTMVDNNSPAPSTELAQVNYGWYYKYYTTQVRIGELYLCWGEKGETSWHRVYVQETMPSTSGNNGNYYLGRKDGKFYYCNNGSWVELETEAEKRCARGTSVVFNKCANRDLLFNGLYEKYRYSQSASLPVGNYAFKNDYDFYYVFTTYHPVPANGELILDTVQGQVWVDDDVEHISTFTTRQYESLTFPSSNELDLSQYIHGNLDANGTYFSDDDHYVSNYIRVYPNVEYQCYHRVGKAYFYTTGKRFISSIEFMTESNTFVIPPDTRYIRFSCGTLPTSSHYLRVNGYSNKLFVGDKMYTVLSCTGQGTLLGINNLVKQFGNAADLAYTTYLNQMLTAQTNIKTRTTDLATFLGDLYRESSWQDDQYVEGDEIKLYTEALDNLDELGQPEYTYDFTFLDLFGSNEDSEFYVEEGAPDYPDIQIGYAAHLIDPDISVNRWAYIDKLEKCYDQEWKTKVEINTKLSLIGQHSFTDLLTRIAQVANETKAKQSVYNRAAYLTSAGYLATQRLEGALDAARNAILGGSSSWYTDERGRIVFEATDGRSAMMLSGAGLLISNTKDEWGDWQWRSALTGTGLAADEVAAAFLSAKEALIGSITTDMIHAAVGNELEIGSNKALQLYATANGERPAGALTTDDSLIEIKAGDGNTPAHVNIFSGGEINLKAGAGNNDGGKINIESNGQLNLASGADMSINSGADLFIKSGGKIDIQSGSTFLVDSTNFKVKSNGNVELTGKVIADEGQIAGFDLLKRTSGSTTINYMKAGSTDSLSSTANGIYIGTDGINFAGKFVVSQNGTTLKFNGAKLSVDAVEGIITMSANNTVNVSAGASINISSGQALNFVTAGTMTIGNGVKPFTIGATTGTNGHAYIYNGTQSMGDTSNNGIYLGTDGINLGAGKFKVTTAGALTATSATITGNITGESGTIGGVTINKDYGMYTNSKTSATSTRTGFLISKDGAIYLGAYSSTYGNCPFQVTSDGAMSVRSGNIAGWSISTASITGNKTGIAKTTNDADIAFWAGNATASSGKFKVTQGGKLTATDAEITGTIKSGSTIACEISADKITSGSMSAARITSGTMSADRISGGTIDATNVTITNLTAAMISGGSLTLGGNNNGNGTITVKNASNSTIGTWDNTGLSTIAGSVGGWTINEKSLSKGSGTSKVVLNADTSTANVKDFAIWVGGDLPSGNSAAPFRVKRDGTLYATKFITVSEPTAQYPEGQESEINLSRYPLWKLSYRTVKSFSASQANGEVTLTIGTSGGDLSVNFNKAASLQSIEVPVPATAYVQDKKLAATVIIHYSDSSTEEKRIEMRDPDNGLYDTGYSRATPVSGSASGRSGSGYGWTFRINKSDGGSVNLGIDCTAIYSDARSGYTQGTFSRYSGATLYTMGQSGPQVYSGTLYTKS